MLYTVGQLMSVLALSKQQWRTFRQVLPRLKADGGRCPVLTAGDFLSAAIVRSVAERLRIPVTAMVDVGEAVSEVCAGHPWHRLDRSRLAIDLAARRATLVDAGQAVPSGEVVILVELGPIASELRRRMMADTDGSQRDLAFPPMSAGGRR